MIGRPARFKIGVKDRRCTLLLHNQPPAVSQKTGASGLYWPAASAALRCSAKGVHRELGQCHPPPRLGGLEILDAKLALDFLKGADEADGPAVPVKPIRAPLSRMSTYIG